MQLHHPGARLCIPGAVMVLALAAAACGGDQPASGDITTGAAPAGATALIARDNEFSPSTLQLPAGDTSISVTNTGDSAHNFVIDGLDVSSGTIEPGDTVTANFVLPAGGAEFVCTFHGGMGGHIETTP